MRRSHGPTNGGLFSTKQVCYVTVAYTPSRQDELLSDRVRFDPRSLITEPFLTCPKCQTDEFGLLLVRGNIHATVPEFLA